MKPNQLVTFPTDDFLFIGRIVSREFEQYRIKVTGTIPANHYNGLKCILWVHHTQVRKYEPEGVKV